MHLEMGTVLPLTEGLAELPEPPEHFPRDRFSQLEGWPPTPRDWQNVTPIQAEAIAGTSLSDINASELLESALKDPRVQEAVGRRFAHIATDPLHIGKGHSDSAGPFSARMTFFSHSRNRAVEVTMKDRAVELVQLLDGYQPREGHEEIDDAIRLARQDARLNGHVERLDAHAILLPNSDEDIGCGHRIMWVTFTDPQDSEGEKLALFAATVDLISQTVLSALPGTIPSQYDGTWGNAE